MQRLVNQIAIGARSVLVLVADVVSILSLVAALLLNLTRISRAAAIWLNPGSGFGLTIIGPDWLRRLHPNATVITLFGTSFDANRHNRVVVDLWGRDNFVWVRQGLTLPYFGAIHDPALSEILFKIVCRLLRWFRPGATCYFSVEDLVRATPSPKWLSTKNEFNHRYESRYYNLINSNPLPPVRVSSKISSEVQSAVRNRFGSDFPRRCALYIRRRGGVAGADLSSLNRVVPSLEDHMKVVRVLNNAGYQVFLTGDIVCPEVLITECAGGLIDWRAAGISRDVFHLFAGTEVDIHVGCLSGGSVYTCVTDIPSLMINAFAPGDAYPRSTVYYKWLYNSGGKVASLNDLLGGMFFDHQLHGFELFNNTDDEMAEAVSDFIKNLDKRPYGIDPASLGIGAPWIRAANARLSPVWLRDYRRRATRCDKIEAKIDAVVNL